METKDMRLTLLAVSVGSRRATYRVDKDSDFLVSLEGICHPLHLPQKVDGEGLTLMDVVSGL